MSFRPTLLFVDNNPYEREAFQRRTRDWPMEVVIADSGRMAIELLEKALPHLVICDIDMPDLNGFEVLKHFTKLTQSRAISFFYFYTGYNDLEPEGFKVGAADVILKPIRDWNNLEKKLLNVALLVDNTRNFLASQEDLKKCLALLGQQIKLCKECAEDKNGTLSQIEERLAWINKNFEQIKSKFY